MAAVSTARQWEPGLTTCLKCIPTRHKCHTVGHNLDWHPEFARKAYARSPGIPDHRQAEPFKTLWHWQLQVRRRQQQSANLLRGTAAERPVGDPRSGSSRGPAATGPSRASAARRARLQHAATAALREAVWRPCSCPPLWPGTCALRAAPARGPVRVSRAGNPQCILRARTGGQAGICVK